MADMKIVFEQNFKLLCSLCQMCVKKILSISLASISKQWFAFYEICSHPFNLCLHDCISKWIREHSDTFLKELLSCLKMENSLAKCLDWYIWAVGYIIKSEKKNWDTLNNCVLWSLYYKNYLYYKYCLYLFLNVSIIRPVQRQFNEYYYYN